jgi:hypothetical protein
MQAITIGKLAKLAEVSVDTVRCSGRGSFAACPIIEGALAQGLHSPQEN